ncbi:DUF262 domain-containing protein [Rudaea cellulosilytica]|uniref:DUF262 domain-containing protein n=1 Tax=Rudaea cellulosilytica TaxID=540746 RepID=UPI0003AA045D|nr:DUF262 domain-containing protein [Rudaea cellulosilytica]
MEARNRSLPDWFTRVRSRQVVLPRFQRFEAWGWSQVESLLNSVLRGLPAGAVLVLEVGKDQPFEWRPVASAPEDGENINEHLLDGQQRLTALWRALHDNYPDRSYFVSFDDSDVGNSIVSWGRWEKEGKRHPLWPDSANKVWEKRLIPLRLMRPDAEHQAQNWILEVCDQDFQAAMKLQSAINALRLKFQTYNIPYLHLPIDTDPDTALDVFVRMNTSATPLTVFDIAVAQIESASKLSLHDLVSELEAEAPTVRNYIAPERLVLSVSALLSGWTPTESSFRKREFISGFIEKWPSVKRGIARALQFLEDEKVFDGTRLPTEVVLYPLAALWANAPSGLDEEGEARTILRKYLWRAFFTERYERTSATRALVDYREISELLAGKDVEPRIFDDSEFRLPTAEQLVEAGWPKTKERLARAVLAVSLRTGGIDFADGHPVDRLRLANREYHHLYPDAWLSNIGVQSSKIYRALNCALVTWRTNRTMAAKAPSKYIQERSAASSLGEAEIVRRIESHLIPYNSLVSDDYDKFLKARAEATLGVVLKLCDGQSLIG